MRRKIGCVTAKEFEEDAEKATKLARNIRDYYWCGEKMKTKRNKQFTDYLVFTIIRAHSGISMRGILKVAKEEMVGSWSIGKVQGSINRLAKEGRIQIKREKIEIDILRIFNK